MLPYVFEVAMFIVGVVVTSMVSVLGFFAIRVLNQLESSVKELTTGLNSTTIELAKFVSKTEIILNTHSEILDAHGERLNLLVHK